MAITDWPNEERPREKLLRHGAIKLSDAELLAIFLRTGVTGKSAVDLARELLSHFGNLRSLFEADQTEFCQPLGLGAAKYAQLQAVLEMAKRHIRANLERTDALENPQLVKDYLSHQLRHQPREVFACLFLDNKHRVISYEPLFLGSINTASIYPREVLRTALECNAAAVIFSHNHPSGIAEPSDADIQITQKLIQALQLVEIRVLDHMIVGDSEVTSLAERGLI